MYVFGKNVASESSGLDYFTILQNFTVVRLTEVQSQKDFHQKVFVYKSQK